MNLTPTIEFKFGFRLLQKIFIKRLIKKGQIYEFTKEKKDELFANFNSENLNL